MAQDMNYAILQPIDYILITSPSIAAAVIRAKTAPFPALAHLWDLGIATHVGLIVNVPQSGKDTYFIAEMLIDGLKINSLRTYLNKGFWGDRIIAVRRNQVYNDSTVRARANDRAI